LETHHHHHHHHHHHKEDDAARFKRINLLSIQRRKTLKKWGFRALCLVAVIMAVLVMLAYTIG
jgi:Co/Zn/Cd efflux system component